MLQIESVFIQFFNHYVLQEYFEALAHSIIIISYTGQGSNIKLSGSARGNNMNLHKQFIIRKDNNKNKNNNQM